jgi:hypothetical protein
MLVLFLITSHGSRNLSVGVWSKDVFVVRGNKRMVVAIFLSSFPYFIHRPLVRVPAPSNVEMIKKLLKANEHIALVTPRIRVPAFWIKVGINSPDPFIISLRVSKTDAAASWSRNKNTFRGMPFVIPSGMASILPAAKSRRRYGVCFTGGRDRR